MNFKHRIGSLLLLLLTLCLLLNSCSTIESFLGGSADSSEQPEQSESTQQTAGGYASVEGIPDYAGEPYVILEDNQPTFTDAEKITTSYERYDELDSLGRCGVTEACIGRDIMPTEDRESISSVKPTGWVNNKYDTELVDGGYLYNRCHLIGFQLTGENANKQNLITGTRYLNIEGMLPFENMVADYVKETGNHVLYRVTPIFVGNNLLASGVRVEGYSVEDNGEGICFHIFAYNVQPGITINYATGDNWLNGEEIPTVDSTDNTAKSEEATTGYVLNTNTKKIHKPTCSSVTDMKAENREDTTKTKEELFAEGYMICGICKP